MKNCSSNNLSLLYRHILTNMTPSSFPMKHSPHLFLCPQSLLEIVDFNTHTSFPSSLVLNSSLTNLNYLSFIKYIPENSLKPRWILVQINYEETKQLFVDWKTTADHHVTYISKYRMTVTYLMTLLDGGLYLMNTSSI